jgi:hypothetical protein
MISLAAILCGVGHSLVKPLKAPLVRKGKKKNKSSNDQNQNVSTLFLLETFFKRIVTLYFVQICIILCCRYSPVLTCLPFCYVNANLNLLDK